MRTLFAALAAFLTLVLSAGTVLADTELGHHGKVGVHSLNEADGQVQCNYSSADDSFQSITVAAPNIYARDKTTGVDTQTVGCHRQA